ncbi:HNH endonuclease [Noviluteimonas gilva]|uniref:Restriction endonuclease n=1 Tax=Noviluteimonas gilva TaxID=2682097 RepID=A0A7C9LXE3_9GAMM|nr:restriction endonuclease [Lysobacter gilvus]
MSKSIQNNRLRAFNAQKGRCHYCACPIWLDDERAFALAWPQLTRKQRSQCRATAEHMQAKQDGGTNRRDNIVAACCYCNRSRHRRRRPLDDIHYRAFVRSRVARGKWPTMKWIGHRQRTAGYSPG